MDDQHKMNLIKTPKVSRTLAVCKTCKFTEQINRTLLVILINAHYMKGGEGATETEQQD